MNRIAIAAVALLLLNAALVMWLRVGPLPAGLLDDDVVPSTRVVDRHGELLYEARSSLGTRSERLDASQLPPPLVAATMAAEDTRFRSHIGIDPIAVARAGWRDLRALRILEGGSTITQQVAKLLIARQAQRQGSRARAHGWFAKIYEATVALRLEHRLSKNEILALYLNLAPYGNQINGAERASQAYFARSSSTLTPAESAFLAALPQQPTRFNPWRDGKTAIKRQRRILAEMETQGWITAATQAAAVREHVALVRQTPASIAPHFVQAVLDDARDRQTDGAQRPSGIAGAPRPSQIQTTLDAPLERTIAGIISARRHQLDEHQAHNVAVAVLDNHTGDWLAWEGSGDFDDRVHGGAIDGVRAPRQPGSALKPFTYAAAFERGFSPGSVLADVPSHFPTAETGILYSPRNYDGIFRGPLLARSALAGSENVPAVALASHVGVPTVIRLLRRAGMTTLADNAAEYGLGITLGNAEMRLDQVIAGYAMFARGGESIAPRMIRSIDGVDEPDAARERVVSAQTAFWITDILSDNDARAFIFGRGGSLEFPFPVAAKTGTSQVYHDNWAIGYTKDVTVGVWVGNFDRTTLRDSTGVTGAGPIFHDVMLAAIERVRGSLPIGDDAPILDPPAGARKVTICGASGLAAGDACPTRVEEWIAPGASLGTCTWHHATDRGVLTVWPDEYLGWARSSGLLTDDDAAPAARSIIHATTASMVSAADADAPAAPRDLTIANPLQGATYLLDPTLRREFQTLPLRVRGATGTVEWFVDGERVGVAAADRALDWAITIGAHRIAARDQDGRKTETAIVVR